MTAASIYQRGVLDGMEAAFLLLLGEEFEGGAPYPGNLNRSAQEYAELHLAAVRETKKQQLNEGGAE